MITTGVFFQLHIAVGLSAIERNNAINNTRNGNLYSCQRYTLITTAEWYTTGGILFIILFIINIEHIFASCNLQHNVKVNCDKYIVSMVTDMVAMEIGMNNERYKPLDT